MLLCQGEDLSLAAALTDYEVTVDGRSCNVTQLDMSQIECLLYSPPHTPNADVTVSICRLLVFLTKPISYGQKCSGVD